MPLFGIAFAVAALLFLVLVILQTVLRQQVHEARFGVQEIHPRDPRFANDLGVIWKEHKRVFERSALRTLFLAVFIAFALSALIGLGIFLYVHHAF